MIFDKLDNINRYGFDLEFVIDDLKRDNFKDGKVTIDDDNKFVIGLSYKTADVSMGVWEAHREYLDIHVLLEGEELIQINDIEHMKSTQEYQHDYELFKGESQYSIHMKNGYFLLLFPNEVHKTSVKVQNATDVKKKVYKLKFT